MDIQPKRDLIDYLHDFVTESYNISVSAALCLYEVSSRLRKEEIDWQLSKEERISLQLEWLKRSIRAGNEPERKFIQEAEV